MGAEPAEEIIIPYISKSVFGIKLFISDQTIPQN